MEGGRNIEGKIVEGGEKAEKLGEARGDGDGEHGVPDEKTNDRGFGDLAFFPGDSGMGDISNDGGDGRSDEIREPEEIVVFNDEIGQDSV